MSVKYITWKAKYLRPKIVLCAAFLLVIFILLLNSHIFFTFAHINIVNGTEFVQCYATDVPSTFIMATWNRFHAFFYSYIPFFIIITANTLLVLTLVKNNKITTNSDNQKSKQRSLNVTTISIAVLFVVFILPTSVISSYYNELIKTFDGMVILYISDSCLFTYHGLNFIVLIATNKQIYRKLILGTFKKDINNTANMEASIKGTTAF